MNYAEKEFEKKIKDIRQMREYELYLMKNSLKNPLFMIDFETASPKGDFSLLTLKKKNREK